MEIVRIEEKKLPKIGTKELQHKTTHAQTNAHTHVYKPGLYVYERWGKERKGEKREKEKIWGKYND